MGFESEPLISIIIPCYNSEKYISKTIESLINQTYKKLQIVCVNDGSKDKTKFLIEEFLKLDSRIELINKENGGIESALKLALNVVKGEYSFLIGHDDTLSNDALAEAICSFNKNPRLDAVRLDLNVIFEDPSKNYIMKDRRVLKGEGAFLETIGHWNIHTFCLWRTNIFGKIKNIDANNAFNFDELATRYLYLNCREVGYCNGIYNYFQHELSVTRTINIRRLQTLNTDVLIRKLLTDANLYKEVSSKFEQYALNNVIKLGTLYYSMKNLNRKERTSAINIIKYAFSTLNKAVLLATFSSGKRKVWSLLFSHFNIFLYYLRIKHLQLNLKR